ncbi:DMT family transporter [Carboxydocella sp. ULO1]|uniref:DMT family transporter n=1 Tax=Carboxydocella sp. ULO1 TaxID=1926599 RepID=UPI0009AE47D8|nr:DMT family transporter [Carboxydocella sp. ULO1]GAW27604.1 hypothetical protein ULO1_01740 [Carboxydocella sp. ULO1]
MALAGLIIATLAISSAGLWAKLATAHGLVIAFYRVFFAVILYLPLMVKHWREHNGEIKPKFWFWPVLAGIFLALHWSTWLQSFKYTSVAMATVLVATHPIFVLLGGRLWLGERLPSGSWSGIFLAILATAGLSWQQMQGTGGDLRGEMLALFSAVMVSAYFLIGRKCRQYLTALNYSFLVYSACALFLALAILFSPYSFTGYSRQDWLAFLALALFPTLLGHSLLMWALKFLPAGLVSLTALSEPVGATLLAALFLHEVPSLEQGIWLGLLLLGIAWTVFASRQKMV